MNWPQPQAGLVIRYAYLWRREAEEGLEEGSKDRPCAIILAVKTDPDDTLVYVLPITHAEPRLPEDGLELPRVTKLRLGLDSDRSWIILTEANIFAWPGPDLRLVEGQGRQSIAYGMLPPKLMAVVRERFLQRVKSRRAAMTKRTS